MWMVDALCQTMQEMYLEADLHNILVFTIITSSSILSVFGALKHIYTYVHRNKQLNEKHTVINNVFSGSNFMLASRSGFEYDGCSLQDSYFPGPGNKIFFNNPLVSSEEASQKQSKKKNQNLKCLSCDEGSWERYCVHGLCNDCCEKDGWCSSKNKHSLQPHTYLPRTNLCYSQGSHFIDLSNLSLSEVPLRLGFHCMKATSLNMSCNLLSQLPGHIAVMRQLGRLDLSHNIISHIPDFFSSFHQLTTLDLRHNMLSCFPKAILGLISLHILLLDHNSLRTIPHAIAQLQFLQKLGLGDNLLQVIPSSVFSICSLRILRLCGNVKLRSLPGEVKKCIYLEVLDLSGCCLRYLPASLGHCSMLKQLKLNHNSLMWLPCEISQCCSLTLLDVSQNPLTTLPATLLYRGHSCSLKAQSCNFLPRKDSEEKWMLVDRLSFNKEKDFPTLSWLALSCIKHHDLDLHSLPIPLSEKILAYSNCFYCGQRNNKNSIRAIKYCPFPSSNTEFPFIFTFCIQHLNKDFNESLSQLDALCVPKGTKI